MQALKCEMCGSSEIVKQNGLYVCQHCGTKYSVEEAKKMMNGVTVVIDNSGSVDNYLTLAKNAIEAKNHKEAEEYCNKIIEIDPNNASAWAIKGEAAGWQGTMANPRFEEACVCFKKSIDADGSEENKANAKEKADDLAFALIALASNNYADGGYDSMSTSLTNTLIRVNETLTGFYNDVGLGSPDLENAYDYAITSVQSAYVNIYNRYQGSEGHPMDFELNNYLDENGNAVVLFVLLATMSNSKENKIRAYKNAIKCCEDKEKSCSYEIGSGGNWVVHKYLTADAKKSVIDMIMSYHKSIKELDPNHKIPGRPQPSSQGCYVATCVYGSYDCPEVWILRRFRDNTLAKCILGRIFIHTYYTISPSLVYVFGGYNWFRKICEVPLNKLVRYLFEQGVSDKPYNDKIW